MKKLLVILILSLNLLACNDNTKAVTLSSEELRAKLEKSIPGLSKIDGLKKSVVQGIYQVNVGRNVFYITQNGEYGFFGNLIDLSTRDNLTQKAIQELSKIDWNKLPLELAIKNVIGNGKYQMAVFTDPDCPYCQMFEQKIIPNLKDTTIYTFMFPLPMHPNAKNDTKKIWCSKDRLTTWISWMRDKKALPTDISCDSTALDTVVKIGNEVVQVDATPTIILSNGQVLQGVIPVEQLTQSMKDAANVVSSK